MNEVKIYQLAKELMIDSKRLVEEARRMGCGVSVPSNSLPVEIARKIREKYAGRGTGTG